MSKVSNTLSRVYKRNIIVKKIKKVNAKIKKYAMPFLKSYQSLLFINNPIVTKRTNKQNPTYCFSLVKKKKRAYCSKMDTGKNLNPFRTRCLFTYNLHQICTHGYHYFCLYLRPILVHHKNTQKNMHGMQGLQSYICQFSDCCCD